MAAWRILRLARTTRWARADSEMRKALATSSVVRPPRERRVRATWDSRLRAGWQHVKISRSRSSGIGSDPSPRSQVMDSSPQARWRRSEADTLRRRSTALRRAVVTSQPAGLSGTPEAGQATVAASQASCSASSARSKSPRIPIRRARTRPRSAR